MAKPLALIEAEYAAKATKSASAKVKVSIEEQATLELCEAVMRGHVKCQMLANITQLEDLSAREKAEQQEENCKCIYVQIHILSASKLKTVTVINHNGQL